MTRPRLLDLFSGAGGCAVGYHRAGFDVVGVDIKPQPRYPFKFWQGDVLKVMHNITHGAGSHGYEGFLLSDFDVIHASPPCQAFSAMTKRWGRSKSHPDLVMITRNFLKQAGLPFVIENVVGAPIYSDLTLCGSMFGLGTKSGSHYLQRHRVFESSKYLFSQLRCSHGTQAITVTGNGGGCSTRDNKRFCSVTQRREAMGIDWMTNAEMSQAIPPAYTEFIGKQLMRAIGASA